MLIFNIEKLNYFNQQYLKMLGDDQIYDRLVALGRIPSDGVRGSYAKAIRLVRERAVTLLDFSDLFSFVFELPAYEPTILVWKKGTSEGARENLTRCRDVLNSVEEGEWVKEKFEQGITALADQYGKGDVFWPLRVALSGKEQSPAPLDIAEALGKTETLRRVDLALTKLAS